MRQAIWLSLLGVLCAGPCAAEEAADHFDRVIAPLLAQRCLDCHQGPTPEGGLDLSLQESAFKGGESGAAIVASDLEKSLIWERVAAGEMPPKKPLPEAERELLKKWIASGAKWGTAKIDPFRFTTEKRAGYDWWSLQPIVRPSVPTLTNDWPRHNPIDAFVQAKLLAKGLTPAPPIDRRALLRRTSFDLLGLPPEPADVEAFSRAPDAEDQLVDRLLASPHYGERWARHWLDVIRFGESQGFERDKLRTNSWRYRDWVVEALNRDLPFRDFVRHQLAGDTLAPDDPTLLAASGFLVAGPFDEVGKTQQSAAMKAVVRQDELEDFVSVVGQSFLGLTVNCARCHDHKFDPILQREYYQLAATMAGVEHGQRNLKTEHIQAKIQSASQGLAARRSALQQQIVQRDHQLREQIRATRTVRREKLTPPKPLAEWTFDSDAQDVVGKLPGQLQGTAALQEGRLALDGKSAYFATIPLEKGLTAKTLVAWVKLAELSQRGGGVIGVQASEGDRFDSIVFGELEPKRWMAGSEFFKRNKSFSGPDENDADKSVVQIAITYAEDGAIAAYRNGAAYGTPYKADSVLAFKPGEAQVIIGMRHGPPGSNKMLRGAIDRAMLFDRALSADEVAALAGASGDDVPQSEVLALLSTEERQQRAQMQFEIDQLADQTKRWQELNTYTVVSHTPHAVQVLARGEPNKPLETVVPGGIAALGPKSADFQLDGAAPDAARRQKLAEWIVAEQNPLAARVLVNRLWHYHFGAGLVETPNDFGFNGARPSHGELLDWLAAEFLASGGSIKHVQRLIVTSATYRQSSLPNPQAMQQDADNRLLWRRSPQRLDAETIRDNLLVASGQLSGEFGGPGYHDFRTFVANSQFYEIVDAVGQTFQRRSLYRTWIRSGRSPLLDSFDCPDPSTKTPARTVTTTPLQALSLLNNSFVLRMSEATAQRVRREAGDDLNQQVPRMYQLLFHRAPTIEERKLTGLFVSEHGLAALARVLINSNEFLYVD